jgi:hypothetical protein
MTTQQLEEMQALQNGQYAQQQQQQPQQMQQQAPQDAPLSPEEIQAAKTALGVDKMEQQVQQMQQIARESTRENLKSTVLNKYKRVPAEALNKELERVKEVDPVWYEQMIDSPIGMDQLVRGLEANIKPKNSPDNVTDSGDQGDPQETAYEKIKKGNLSGDALFLTLGEMQLS